MSVMGGIADIFNYIKKGNMILGYSGGLHHVQIPGQTIPGIFKTIRMNYESIKIEDFISICESRSEDSFKNAVIAELEERMKKNIPSESE
jgi:hypothetical protein